MNKILESIHACKSVRAYTEQPIAQETLQKILQAACAAPTAGNQQLYTILNITDQGLKNTLAHTCDDQPFIASAPAVLIFCADCQKYYDLFEVTDCNPRTPGVGDLMLAVSDANIAAQNAVMAAESLGLGSCYIGDIMERAEEHRALLDLPPYVFPAAMLVMGYPTQHQIGRRKPERCPLESIVCENAYERKDADELRKMMSSKWKRTSFEEWAEAFCARKYNSDFAREMSRSVAEYIETFAD